MSLIDPTDDRITPLPQERAPRRTNIGALPPGGGVIHPFPSRARIEHEPASPTPLPAPYMAPGTEPDTAGPLRGGQEQKFPSSHEAQTNTGARKDIRVAPSTPDLVAPTTPDPVPVDTSPPSTQAASPRHTDVPADAAHRPSDALSDADARAAFKRLCSEGVWGKLAANLALRAHWHATRPGFYEPFHSDELRSMRQEGARIFPLRPILAWDEHETSEPPRALKNDWRALWMGGMSGQIIHQADDILSDFPQIEHQPGDTYAVARDEKGMPIGVVVLYERNGVWRDRDWISRGAEANRALLAIVLRFARDGKHSIVLKHAPVELAVERGAFWAWEWAVAPSKGGIWGRGASLAFAWRAKMLSSEARKKVALASTMNS